MTKTTKRDAGESFVVLQGLSWPGHRAEAGEIRSDIPPASVEWLLARKAIRPPTAKDRAAAEKETS